MKKSTDFHDFIVYDIFSRLEGITSRTMMGGWCMYSNGTPFGVILGDTVYLKTRDSDIIVELQHHGSEQFSYTKKDGKVIYMQYWSVPAELLDHTEYVVDISRKVIERL